MENIYLTIVLAPLAGAILAGLFGKQLGRVGAHTVTILGVGVSFLLSLVVFKYIVIDGNEAFNGPVYTWMVSEGINMQVGFLVDNYSLRTVFAWVAALQAVFFALMVQLSGIAALLVAMAFMLVVFGQIPINDVLIGRMARSEWRSRASGSIVRNRKHLCRPQRTRRIQERIWKKCGLCTTWPGLHSRPIQHA